MDVGRGRAQLDGVAKVRQLDQRLGRRVLHHDVLRLQGTREELQTPVIDQDSQVANTS